MTSSQPAAAPRTELRTLGNGLRVAVTPIPQSQAATLAAYVRVGSRDEARETLGLSHYLEHMLFKGTERRPEALQISSAIEGAGGMLNAFTTREMTAYWNRVPFDKLGLAMDLLADSVQHSLLEQEEIERERTVILSEIRRAHDQPAQRAAQLAMAAAYAGDPLGWDIAGDEESVGAIVRGHLADHVEAWYRPRNMVLSVAGNFGAEEAFELAEEHWGAAESRETPARAAANGRISEEPVRIEQREIEQCNLQLALRTFHRLDPDRYALRLLDEVLGRGMSSRLFLEVRERRGLAYSVGSHASGFDDAGHLGIAAGVSAKDVLEAVEVILGELRRLVEEPVGEDELERAREHAIGSFRLSLETSAAWCHRAGGELLANGNIESVDEVIAGYQSVTPEDIQRVARRCITPGNLAACVVGPFARGDELRELIAAGC